MKAFRIYHIFYGLLRIAYFVMAMFEGWQSVQKHAGTVSQEVLAVTGTLNGLGPFSERLFSAC